MYVVHISIMVPSNLYALQVPIEWEEVDVTPILKGGKTVIPDAAISSVKKNTVALKGTYACSLSPFTCVDTSRRSPRYPQYV